MAKITILHGTDHIIEKPSYENGKETNDYGKGFYCTLIPEIAKEWACKGNTDGFVNKYELETDGLRVLNLLDGTHTVLNWIAILLQHRVFTIQDEIAKDAKDYIIKHFAVDISGYDVVIGYRADDSYFSYALSFISNTLPLRGLNQALMLGKLGEQTVLVSEKAFKQLVFIDSELVPKKIYYPKFQVRDDNARKTYKEEIKKSRTYRDDIFVMDILREEIKNDDSRIQRIVFK